MHCEVVAVGTELLLGQIVDTNSAWIGERLSLAGIDAHFQTRVGDNHERIVGALRIALARSEAVIVCGGLGPTQDDITREAIAEIMGVGLVRDEGLVARIRERFRSRGREMPENNKRQADVPRGASIIPQIPGTAPGLICPVGTKVVYAVPGVPHELQAMVDATVIPDLKRRSGADNIIRSRVLRTWGWSESRLAELLAEQIAALDERGNPTLAFLASGIEGLKVRVTAKAANVDAADQMIAVEETKVRETLGSVVFGIDGDTMESVVTNLLRARGLTLAVAESATGGLVGARLTAVPGANDVFRGAIVACAGEVEFNALGLPGSPVLSKDAAGAMAAGVRKVLNADVGLATTGIVGPGVQEGQRAGTVFLGLALGDVVEAQRIRLPGDPERIRQYAVISLLNMLRLRLLNDA